jgi:hypothetical protein
MQNAKQRGLIRAVQHRQRGQHMGRMGSIYVCTQAPIRKADPRRVVFPAPGTAASVWDLGARVVG